jgi:putative ABC transport system permease protein
MWRRQHPLQQLDDDIRDHLERETEDNLARGMSRAEARRRALLAFGNPALVRENTRAVWIARWLETLRQDVRNSLRILVRQPGVSTAAILSLAVGIGANTAVFSVVNRVLLRPLPYQQPDRLVMISARSPTEQRSNATIPEYIAWERYTTGFAGLTTAFQQPLVLAGDDPASVAENVLVEKIRSSLFSVLGVQPAIGRAFGSDEERTDAPAPVALLSDEFWASRYQRDPAVVGRVIRLSGVPTTIIGVMPPGFSFLPQARPSLYVPLSWNSPQLRGTARVFPTVARLKPGVTIAQAQTDMDAVVKAAAGELPAQSAGWGARLIPLHEAFVGDIAPSLILLQGVVGFVLLIACANVAGLLLVRATARRTEIAVRAAIGAGRGRIVRQLLTESTALAISGGLAGLAVGWLLLRLLVRMGGGLTPMLPDVNLDGRVLVFTLAASVLTGVVVGVLPALAASRADLVDGLKASAKGTVAALGGRRMRHAVVVAQIALSFVLLIGAGLTLRSLVRLETRDLGGDPSGVLRMQVPFTGMFRQVGSAAGYPVAEAVGDVTGTIDRILDRLRTIPGVVAVAGGSLPPYASAGPEIGFSIEGRVAPAGEASGTALTAAYQVVTPGFFATMRIPLERGREFEGRDTTGGPWGVVINAAMARRFWPGEDPLGRRVRLNMTADEEPREIIGVVSNYRSHPYELETEPALFVHYRQQPKLTRSPLGLTMRNRMNFVLRTSEEPESVAGAVRAAMAEIDRERPIADLQSVEASVGLVLAPSRYAAVIFSLFAGVALFLAAVGTYGVMGFDASHRTREIGIRMALGATSTDVVRLVMRQVLLMAAVGVGLGLAGAVALTRLMPNLIASLTWGIQPIDLPTYVAVAAMLASVALLAGWIPTRRAIRIAPTLALRCE